MQKMEITYQSAHFEKITIPEVIDVPDKSTGAYPAMIAHNYGQRQVGRYAGISKVLSVKPVS